MSKFILTGDMPKSCSVCKFLLNRPMGCKLNYNLDVDLTNFHERHPKCPLQDTTELLEALEVLGDLNIVNEDMEAYPITEDEYYIKLNKALGGQ